MRKLNKLLSMARIVRQSTANRTLFHLHSEAEIRAAFAKRDASGAQLYSHERKTVEMPAQADAALRRNKKAWAFFSTQAPTYQRAAAWWIVSAKRAEAIAVA